MTAAFPFPLYLSLCCAGLFASNTRAGDQASVDRYILFGFGPFAGRVENASWQSVKQFSDGAQVRSVEVPVVWTAPRPKLLQAANDSVKVVLVGLGEGGSDYAIETIAFNERGNLRDEADNQPLEPLIDVEGAARLEANEAAQPLAEKLSASGFPARISRDAGRFLCNEMLYELLRMQRENPNIPAVYFIHVPVLGSEISRNGQTVTVDHAYCAEFGRALVASLRELHPLIESAPTRPE